MTTTLCFRTGQPSLCYAAWTLGWSISVVVLGACFPDLPANPEVDAQDDASSGEDVVDLSSTDSESRCEAASDCPGFGATCLSVDCVAGACTTAVRVGETCDDGLACTDNDVCSSAAACAGTARACATSRPCETASCRADDGACVVDASACVCATDADCDDSNPCTNDACAADGSSCSNEPAVGLPCDDGACCTVEDSCLSDGTCRGTERSCVDPRSCAVSTCDEEGDICSVDASGCECSTNEDCASDYACATARCDVDSGACSVDESGCECFTGADCDDGNPCTRDECSTSNTCVHSQRSNGYSCQETGLCVDASCRDDMVLVPGGGFRVGCDGTTGTCPVDANPQRLVTLPAYLVDLHEVSVIEYRACVEAAACDQPGTTTGSTWTDERYDNHPVNNVSWTQARDYCVWAEKRLCSEAEWEMAARGRNGDIWVWGDTPEPTCEMANLHVCGFGFPMARLAKSQDVSAFGAREMQGNVQEWVEDCYRNNLGTSPEDGSAVSPESCSYRVMKGGSYGSRDWEAILYARKNTAPYQRFSHVGFRCCRSL